MLLGSFLLGAQNAFFLVQAERCSVSSTGGGLPKWSCISHTCGLRCHPGYPTWWVAYVVESHDLGYVGPSALYDVDMFFSLPHKVERANIFCSRQTYRQRSRLVWTQLRARSESQQRCSPQTATPSCPRSGRSLVWKSASPNFLVVHSSDDRDSPEHTSPHCFHLNHFH